MVQQEVKPTRMELNEIRANIALSDKGYLLLKMKRDGLMLEFFNVFSKARNIRSKLTLDYKKAENKLNIAKCIDGENKIVSAAFSISYEPTVVMGTKNVMGVTVPTTIESGTVKRKVDKRGYGIVGMSTRINDAITDFEQVVEDIILAAELETTLKKLINEIEKTKRKVNALEFKILPELKETEAFIRLRLEEMERENIFRLKKIKSSKK